MRAALKSFATHRAWQARRRRMAAADATGRPFVYRHALLGDFIYHPGDDLSRHVLLYDFERPELEWAMARAAEGGTMLDVGANIGVFTVAWSRAAAAAHGRVIALEPSPSAFARLEVTCAALELPHVELLPVAAAHERGRRAFVAAGVHALRQHLADARPVDAAQLIEVEARTLDEVCGRDADAVRLIKIDVEGHEAEVLAGAGRVLRNGRAAVLIEIFPAALRAAGSEPDAIRELLSRTHQCVAVITEDSRTLPGTASWDVAPPHEKIDTCWEPR